MPNNKTKKRTNSNNNNRNNKIKKEVVPAVIDESITPHGDTNLSPELVFGTPSSQAVLTMDGKPISTPNLTATSEMVQELTTVSVSESETFYNQNYYATPQLEIEEELNNGRDSDSALIINRTAVNYVEPEINNYILEKEIIKNVVVKNNNDDDIDDENDKIDNDEVFNAERQEIIDVDYINNGRRPLTNETIIEEERQDLIVEDKHGKFSMLKTLRSGFKNVCRTDRSVEVKDTGYVRQASSVIDSALKVMRSKLSRQDSFSTILEKDTTENNINNNHNINNIIDPEIYSLKHNKNKLSIKDKMKNNYNYLSTILTPRNYFKNNNSNDTTANNNNEQIIDPQNYSNNVNHTTATSSITGSLSCRK